MSPLMLITSNTLVRYHGDETHVTIPKGISEIKGDAFRGCEQLQSVTIPQGVTVIGPDAFRDCTSLEHVTIPHTVRTVGDHAFRGCRALQSASFERYIDLEGNRSREWLQEHDSICEVGRGIFFGCGQLRSLTIAHKTADHGFGEIEQVVEQLVDEVKPKEYHFTDKEVIRVKLRPIDEREPLKLVVLPKGQKTIKSNAFYGSDLGGISLPDSLTSIESHAFSFCTKLVAITLPDSVRYIGPSAFHMCLSLVSVNVPKGVHTIRQSTFWKCSSLRSITLPKGVRSIEAEAFYGCISLRHVELREGLQLIERYAFEGTGLRSIHIPATVNSIGRWKGVDSRANIADTFSCPYLERISVDERNRVFDSRGDCNALIRTRSSVLVLGSANTVIPNSVTAIGSQAFNGLRVLRRIRIPDSVTRIGWAAFDGCEDLEHVTFGKGLRTISDGAFNRCTKLRSIELPEGLEELGEGCFSHCESLTSVRIPDSVTNIGIYAFSSCTSLERVWIGKGLRNLRTPVFASCPNLKAIVVDPDNPWLVSQILP